MDAKFQIRPPLKTRLLRFAIGVWAALILAASVAAQDQCVSQERLDELRTRFENGTSTDLNTALTDEILKMRATLDAASRPAPSLKEQPKETVIGVPDGPAVLARMCELMRIYPWPGVSSVGKEAASAWISLVKNYFPFSLQRLAVPVIDAGVSANEIVRDVELASFIDRLRLRSGMPQLFGTQVTSENGFLVLSPLMSEDRIDKWRKEYGLNSLREYISQMQISMRMPVIRSTERPKQADPSDGAEPGSNESPEGALLKTDEREQPVRVDTAAVIVNATVFGPATVDVTAEDFKIYEDEQEQKITSFAASEAPFDIVLLLDLSGSTANKVGLIKKTTKRFIEMKRDVDRIAIVTFTSEQTVVSPLETDRKRLSDRISKIKGYGASHVWDALKFSFDMLRSGSAADRRKAVVLMSDGAENALTYLPRFGSRTLLADLVEEIRNGDFAVFPIYLDTERRNSDDARTYEDARRTLRLFAAESGGNFYTADSLGDLGQVYEKVMGDVGRVYSLGYEPQNDRRDGRWRSIRVELPNKPGLKIRARPGYYAK